MTLTYTVPLFVNGQERITQSTFEVTSPTTGQMIYECSSASLNDVQDVADAAAQAFTSWRKVPPASRRDLFLKTAEIMESRKAQLAAYMVDEIGCSQHWADFNVSSAVEILKDTAGRIASIEGSVVNTENKDVKAMILKEPYGTVLGIAPWNAPYILGIRAIAYPLAAGNTTILKGSQLSPRAMWGIVDCFHQAGLPAGVLSLIFHAPHNAPTITSALIAHSTIKKINFTGSTGVGRIIAKLAADYIKPVPLEPGGKAPAILWSDADLPQAAAQAYHVRQAVYSVFKEELVIAMRNHFRSHGDAAVLVTEAAVPKTTKLVQNAIQKGATIVAGELPLSDVKGTKMRRVAIEGISPQMDLYHTESFGPVVSLFLVETEDEALKLANDTEYGLSLAIFTSDLGRAMRLAEGIETGAVHINSMSVHDEPGLPHDGAKASGYGRFNSTTWT